MKKLFLIMFSLLSIGAKAQVLPRYTDNQKSAVNRCRTLDVSVLNGLKGAMVAQGVIGGTAGVANVTSAVLTGTNKTDDMKKQLASNIMTGAATVGSGANTVISGVQLSKINDLIDDMEACQEGLANIPDDSEATEIKSDNNTYLKEND